MRKEEEERTRVTEEKESVDAESELPPSMYSAPPQLNAEQESKCMSDRRNCFDSESFVAIAPPLDEEQEVKVRFEMV